MMIRMHWNEDAQRVEHGMWSQSDRSPLTPQGDQFFSEVPTHDRRTAINLGAVLVLSYDAWQALGGPIDITVGVVPASTS